MTTYIPVLGALLFAALIAALAGGARAYQRRQRRLDHEAVDERSPISLTEDELLDRKWEQRWMDSDAAFWRTHGRCGARDYARDDRAAALRTQTELNLVERSSDERAGRRADVLARGLHKRGPAWRVFKATSAVDLWAVLALMDGWHGWHGATTDTREWTAVEIAELNEMLILGAAELVAEREGAPA